MIRKLLRGLYRWLTYYRHDMYVSGAWLKEHDRKEDNANIR